MTRILFHATLAALAIAVAVAPPGVAAVDREFRGDGIAEAAQISPTSGFQFAGVARLGDGSFGAAGAISRLALQRWDAQGSAALPLYDESVTLEPHAVASRAGGLVVAGADRTREGFAVGAFDLDLARDRAFGEGGFVHVDLPGAGESARAVTVAGDGGVYAAGYARYAGEWTLALVKLTRTGDVDDGFGDRGHVIVSIPRTRERAVNANPVTSLKGIVVQDDGRILAVGSVVDARSRRVRGIVLRYLPDGRLDPTFAAGRGWRLLAFPGGEDFRATAVAVHDPPARPGGMVIAGRLGRPASGAATFGLARLWGDGLDDRGFGNRGRVATDVGPGDGATSVLVFRDGNVAVAGTAEPSNRLVSVAMYRPSGRLDRRFGAAGVACVSKTSEPVRLGTAGPVELNVTSLLHDGSGFVVGAQVQDLGDRLIWILGRFRRRSSPAECVWITRAVRRRANLHFALGHAGRVRLEVARFTRLGRLRRVGSVDLGYARPGLRTLGWDLRVGGRRLAPLGLYRIWIAVADGRGRLVGRAAPTGFRPAWLRD